MTQPASQPSLSQQTQQWVERMHRLSDQPLAELVNSMKQVLELWKHGDRQEFELRYQMACDEQTRRQEQARRIEQARKEKAKKEQKIVSFNNEKTPAGPGS